MLDPDISPLDSSLDGSLDGSLNGDTAAIAPPASTRGAQAWLSWLKPHLRWVILGLTFFFIATTLKQHWQGVMALRLRPQSLGWLAGAVVVTLGAHIWSGAVWGRLLQTILGPQGPRLPRGWAIATYLRTNLAKYLPGNIWHFYGRLQACRQRQIPTQSALLSIVLEPLLMAAAALFLACLGYRFSPWQPLALIAILVGVHPRCLNPLVQALARSKLRSLARRGLPGEPSLAAPPPDTAPSSVPSAIPAPPVTSSAALNRTPSIRVYPWVPLLGELLFVLLRGIGFWLAVQALVSTSIALFPRLMAAFSIAWVLGLVVPGAPGGIGVFEATAIALLQGQLSAELVLGAVACYRLVSTFAEVVGAAIAPLCGPSQKIVP